MAATIYNSTSVMDGSTIKALVDDPQAFSRYVNQKFHELDNTNAGKLSRQDVQPLVVALGDLLGLPPKGASPQSDHIYDEVLDEFFKGKKREYVTKEEFATILRDIFLGVADGLERDPVVLKSLDGADLESYANSSKCEVDAIAIFQELDQDGQRKVSSSKLKEALMKLNSQQGMPPTTDPSVLKNLVEPALESLQNGINKDLSQEVFIVAYRNLLLCIASSLKQKPVTVAHTEKRYDGSSITAFLKDKTSLDKALDNAWVLLDRYKGKDGKLPSSCLLTGLDFIAPSVGLPPVGAIDEIDRIVKESFKLVSGNQTKMLGKEEFHHGMLQALGSIMLQLEGKPVTISVTTAANNNPLINGLDLATNQTCSNVMK